MPTTERSIYDEIADEQVRATNDQATQSIAVNIGNNPDAVGQAQRLGAATGAGPDVALHDPEGLQKSLAVQQMQERDLASWNPMLARQLADPNFAAISHDQIDNLSTTGTLFQRTKDALAHPIDQVHSEVNDLRSEFAQGKAQYERGMLGIKAKRGEATAEDYNRIRELTPTTSEEPKTVTGKLLGGLSSMAGSIAPMLPAIGTIGTAGAVTGMGAGALAGSGAFGVGAVPAAIAGAFTGFGMAAESEFGARNYETMAGNAYLDMLNRGVDESRAQYAAGMVGAVNTALQLGVIRVAGKPLAGATTDLFNKALGDTVADAMTRPTTAKAIQSALLQWGKNTAIGTGEMGLQTIVNQFGNDFADGKGQQESYKDLFTPEFGKQLGQSIVDAALTMGTINAATGMLGFSANLDRVKKAEQSATFFENLSQNAVDSKVRDRNPDAYESFIQNQAQGTGAENIYIEGREMANLLNQSGLDPEKVEAAIPGLHQQIADATASGGDVTIPTEQYAARLAGSPLGEAMKAHMRLDPDAMSATEALTFQEKQKEIFEQTRQEAEQHTAANEEFAKSAKVVEKNIFDQLKATKTMPDDVARTNASFVRDFVVTQAARQNMTPEAFFDKYRYTIEAATGDLRGKLAQSFIQAPDGEYHFGEITPEVAQEAGISAGKLRLREGDLTAGRAHIEQRRGASIEKQFGSIENLVQYIGHNYDAIYRLDNTGDGGEAYDVAVKNPAHGERHGRLIVRIEKDADGNYYDVRSVMEARPNQFAKKTPLWERTGISSPLDENNTESPLSSPSGSPSSSPPGPKGQSVESSITDKEILRQASRGGFDPSSLTTLLGAKADMSTFLHETAHYFLSVYGEIAKDAEGDAATKEDFGKLLNWFGVKDQATWDGMSLDEQRKYHEQFAYSYEKYLAEGKAPSIEAQGVFDRFTQWLKRVYKSVRDDINTIYKQQHGEDLPIMTGEVKEVMDRMLASDEQIKQAEAIRNMEPVFKSQEKSGMNDAEWKAYGEMANTATDAASAELSGQSIREMQWMSTAKGRLLKAMQVQHDGIRESVRAEVRDELVKSEPVYKAQHFLRTGEFEGEETVENHKMDTAAVKDLLPEGRDVRELFGMTKKGGLHPDEVAAAAGFKDGKELIDSIVSSPSFKDAVGAATDQRMLEQYGDISTPNALAAAVEKAVHNEARARLIAFEMRHAFNMEESERVLVKAARETARKMIEQEKFSDINPSAYAAREARAARQAQAAAARGDAEAVGRAKRDQLLQNALTSEALKVKAEADKHLRYLNKFDNPSTAVTKAIGADHMDAINELLAGYAMAPRERYSQRSDSMANWINAEYGRTGVMPAVSDELVDRLGTMHWKDMNIIQLRDLRDAVKSLDYTGRRQTLVMLGEKAQSIDEFVKSVQETLADMKHTPVEDIRARLKYAKGLDKLSAKFLSLKSWVKSADAAFLKMEQLFQWIDAGKDAGLKEAPVEGPMQSLYRLASGAESKERAMRAEATKAMRELHESLKGSKINLSDTLDVPELPRDGNTRWYRGELISMALNMGNESNKTKLLMGYGWDEMSAVSAINRLLSSAEMNFVQGTWDHLASYGQGIVELQRRQTGVMPQMIESTPLITKHGTFKGGYYPVVFNDVLDSRAAENQARNADQLFENNYAKPATASGHTIGRTGYIGPIFLDLGVISRHIDQVTHDLAWREAIIDMNKVLSDKRLVGEINQVYGREYSKQFRPWLQAMANDKVFRTTGETAIGKGMRKLRSNFTMVQIGFKASTMMIHGTSALSNSLGELGPVWFAKGMNQFVGVDRFMQAREFMYERSPEMANRMNELDRNVHEAINEIEKHQNSLDGTNVARKLYDNARKFAFRGVGILDMASAGPTWMGAYLKGMAHESDGGLGLGEDSAIAYADRAVRNAHGGGGTKDMAWTQRSDELSLFAMFYSYWNHVYNRQRDIGKGWNAMRKAPVENVRDFPKLLSRSFFYIVVPQIAHGMLAAHKKNDDGDMLEGFTKEAATDIGLGFFSGIPVVRDVANAVAHETDYKLSPLETPFRKFIATFQDAKKIASGDEPSKRAFQNAAESVGYATGLPTAQPAATAKFLYDVMDGSQNPEDVADWWKGVLTGKIK